MNPAGTSILDHLRAVEAERRVRSEQPLLAARVQAVKTYQQARFRRTYADLLQDPRYANASRFFLSELYGPDDFAQRDAQFARIVPALVRLFPHEIVDTVAALAALHALSEALDTEMGRRVASPSIDRNRYIEAWQSTGRPDDRERQISLMLGIGRALDHYTRNPLLRRTLRFMRAPARAAGLGELQSFLERGFDTFGAMRGAQAFLDTVARRERALAARLFGVHVVASETFLPFDAEDPLVQLP